VVDRLGDELDLAREMILLRAPGDPGAVGDCRGGQPGVAVIEQLVDGRVEQPPAGDLGPGLEGTSCVGAA
jgi:hypothetical protein